MAPVSDSDASHLENLHVHQVYDQIYSHFSETRSKPWPNIIKFINTFPIGSILVDVGCGNGRYLGINKTIFEVGCDRCTKLAEECHDRANQVLVCDCLMLPLKSNCADGVISIAVIHHLATYERRLQAINEIIRILKPGGQGLIYVWAKEQVNDNKMSTYLKQNRKNRTLNADNNCNINNFVNKTDEVNNEFSLPVHKNRTQFKHQDILVPWKLKTNKDIVYYRFYHIFRDGELENMFLTIKNIKVIKSFYDQGNWCVHLEKLTE